MRAIPALWKANIIAFASSFCVMVIELVAGRMLAPAIGVSLYTWTSIIGVILAGIALGNYLGGRIADRYASPSLLATVLFAGTLATLAILPMTKTITAIEWFSSLHLMLNSTLRVACIFFLPAIILSMVSPLVIKLTLADLGKTGGVVGTIYACSTVGSILGTFMTGFYFVLWFGTRTTIWLVVAALMLIGIMAWFSWKIPHRWAFSIKNIIMWILALLVILSAITLLTFRDSWQQSYTKESNYYSINVMTFDSGGEPGTKTRIMKVLALDHLIHSYVTLDEPTLIHYDYLKVFAGLIKYWTRDNPQPAVLQLGGGGYSLPRYLEVTYPGSSNDVVEIDPVVTEVAYQELGLPRDTRINTYNQDARIFLSNPSTRSKYNIIIGDVFNDLGTPYHLTTIEFDRMVKASLKDGGVYLVNVIDDYLRGEYMSAHMNTLKHVFNYVYLFTGYMNTETSYGGTFVIAATDRKIDFSDFNRFRSENGDYGKLMQNEGEKEVEEYLAQRKPILLTDDYAPTDVLVAPLFRFRAERR
jgi:predicted membrane-bound spermidine synthase